MIVKNEEKYLRKCLEALSPILKLVNSELIIADTGSSDDTVKIAEEFTKNVYYFEWCNDFAAARNSVMKRAKGSWFMSIDADEILDEKNPFLDLEMDPKISWALRNIEKFPIEVNKASLEELLRVPGVGTTSALRIVHLETAILIITRARAGC
jgi:glycosyltransferase involved in cell wall biosynthesis